MPETKRTSPLLDLLLECEDRKVDPVALLTSVAREIALMPPDAFAALLHTDQPATLEGDEDDGGIWPCDWCRRDDGTWTWCSLLHWWICGAPGFMCIDCNPEPLPE